MPRCCCVPLCKSNAKKTPQVGFHEFPCDAKRREAWLRSIAGEGGRGPKWLPTDTSLVCSLHFTQDDYRASSKIRLLLPTAVPSVFPGAPERKAVALPRKRPRPESTESTNNKQARVKRPTVLLLNRSTLNQNGTLSTTSNRAAVQQAVENGDKTVKHQSCQTSFKLDANDETTRALRAKVARLQEAMRTLRSKLDKAEERAEFYENNKDIDCFMKVIDAAALGDETAEFIVNEVYSFHEGTKLI